MRCQLGVIRLSLNFKIWAGLSLEWERVAFKELKGRGRDLIIVCILNKKGIII